MKFYYVNNDNRSFDVFWFEQAYLELLDRLNINGENKTAEYWIGLVDHWNEIKTIVTGEESRVNWAESQNVNDENAVDRAREFRSKIRPLATFQDAHIRRKILETPTAKQAVREHYGNRLVDFWLCANLAHNPVNINIETAENELISNYHSLRGKAQVQLEGAFYSLTGLEKLMEHAEEKVRKAAFDTLINWYQENKEELDSIFIELVDLRTRAAKNMDYPSFTHLGYKRMFRLDYGPEEVAQFRNQILRHVTPMACRLRGKQALLYNGEKVKPWNRNFDPHNILSNQVLAVDSQLSGVLEIFQRLHPELATYFQFMIDKDLIDLENRPGKRGGAFCTEMPDKNEVRIFCNSVGVASDVWTLLHESGHAFQAWKSQWMPINELRSPTLELAEIHSMGMEYLAFPHLEIFFNNDDCLHFKLEHLVKAVQFLCYACVVDAFQHHVYEHPGADAWELNEVWRNNWNQFITGEDWSDYPEALGNFWKHKLHIITRPFYYIDYALALLCALQLWMISHDDPSGALDLYMYLCRAGGTASFSELVKQAGLKDPFAEETLIMIIDVIQKELTRNLV